MRTNLAGILIFSFLLASVAMAGGYDDSYLGAMEASEKARKQYFDGQEREIGKKPKLVDDRYVIDVHSSSTDEFKDLSGSPRKVIRYGSGLEDDKNKATNSNKKQEALVSLDESESQKPVTAQIKKEKLTSKDIEGIMRQRVSYSTAAATIKEIAQSIMPKNWLVETDFHKTTDLDTRLYRFENTKPRQQALIELFSQVSNANVSARYLWDLVDSNGNPTPKLIIFEQ